MIGALEIGQSYAAHARASCHPLVDYKGQTMEWDFYDDGAPALHMVCPRCARFGLITAANKRFHVDDRGKLHVEPFRCDYCLRRFAVADSQMVDA